ncbi:two-component system sensor histidine kinase NtrB [Sphingomonas sp. Y38-1Y]|uniref:two-component system sensor histidine kinase NtrB n=1 Tax=Sphingomonas sp. Y38-1Y TaxID=3078265 RepID=UPI0028E59F4C|nr:ATP-binding protein [Sphingomonas sp. Y38-1Y]
MALARGGLRVEGGPAAAELFAALPVAVLVLDPGDGIVFANGACELLLNQSDRSMRGLGLTQVLVLPEEFVRGRERGGLALLDTDLVTRRGHRIRVDMIEAMLPESGWRVVTLHDASAGRRHGVGDRGGARAAMGAAAMLAHEIKNPLSGIRGAAQLLADESGEQELTGLITTEVDRVAALIDRMQDFTDTRPPALEGANIYPLLAHAKRLAQAGFARGVTIEERFDPSLPDVLIDRDRFVQVMVNLMKNAAEALQGRRDPRMQISTAYRHGMSASTAPGRPRQKLPIEICVVDNGPGAPADIAEHLFEPFVSGKPEGQGLGLPLVDKLVRDMGGIVAYAREGEPEWTVLRILLPRAGS